MRDSRPNAVTKKGFVPDPAKNAASQARARQRAARRFAMQGLYEWHLTSNRAAEIEARTRAENAMHKVDLNYYHLLLSRVIADVPSLDALLAQAMPERAVEALDGVERAILRIGCFELRDQSQVPYKIVIDEAIELAKEYGATDSHKYVNAVLDKLAQSLRWSETGNPAPVAAVDESADDDDEDDDD